MPKIKSLVSFLKFFASDSAEDFRLMDKKLLRIGATLGSFIIGFLFWYYFLRGTGMFGF